MTRAERVARSLEWRPLLPSNDPKFLVNGAELSQAIVPGFHSRFALVEIRCRDAAGFADRRIAIKDAGRVSDEDVRAGKRPPTVATADDDIAAIAMLRAAYAKHLRERRRKPVPAVVEPKRKRQAA